MGLLSQKAAPKGLLASAQKLQKMGNGGDSILAHINSREAAMLKQMGGAGTVNKRTGLLQFEGTGGNGNGEGPGSEGGTGGNGPGGGGQGGPGNGASGDPSGEQGTGAQQSKDSMDLDGTHSIDQENTLGTAVNQANSVNDTLLGKVFGMIAHAVVPATSVVDLGIHALNNLTNTNNPDLGHALVGFGTGAISGGPATDGTSGSGDAHGDSIQNLDSPPPPPRPAFNPVNPFSLPPLQFPGQVPTGGLLNPTNPLFRFGNRGLLGG